MLLRRPVKARLLLSRAGKGTDDAHARQGFPQHPGEPVEPPLHRPVKGYGLAHNPGHDEDEQRDSRDEYQRQPPIDRHRHDDAADTEKGGADHQPDQHGHCILKLIDIVGKPVYKGGCGEPVKLRVGKGLDAAEHCAPQPGAESLRGDGGHVLAHQRAQQADGDNSKHEAAHAQDIAGIAPSDALVDDAGHQQGKIQLKDGFRQFGGRPQDAVYAVGLQKFKKRSQ